MFAVPGRSEAVAELEAAGADGTLRHLDRLAALL
ncbi:hypothetical protein BKA00_000029 [Actinomadura coerulea]|uniref:Uncharacterized protein n=1 Tax=Actinomadura coerulea TaxID=46159 RepID=A0A7X0FTX1_9ACTN|nr:hypothetical protein [Actinomadura coerulea]